MKSIFTSSYVEAPYWWDAAPRETPAGVELPASSDVVVIGSGFTGLSAALTLASAGRKVLVLDKGAPGSGASTRNVGNLSRSIAHALSDLLEKRGEQAALALYSESRGAYDYLLHLIRSLDIACDVEDVGRFQAAISPQKYEAMAREAELRKRYLGDDYHVVPKGEQGNELGANVFYGGIVVPDYKSLHPGKYHAGLLARARERGAEVVGHTAATAVRSTSGGFEVQTARGTVAARNVVIATNGYPTSALGDWHRCVIPFDAYVCATEQLTDEQIRAVLPGGRPMIDSAFNIDFIRSSPDKTRLIFGGLTGVYTGSLRAIAQRLHNRMSFYFPRFSNVKLDFAWTGRCAATWDKFPHIGVRDGIHYAMGYCFSGVPLGTYLGNRVAEKILGRPEGQTAFDPMRLEKKFYYFGQKWFVPAVMKYYAAKDNRARAFSMPKETA